MTANRDFGKILNGIKKRVGKSIGKRNMKRLGRFAIEQVKRRTRAGYGVRENGDQAYRLPALSDSYIRQRRRAGRRLSKYTSPGKSNLTFTSQLLNSLKVVIALSNGQLVISPTGVRRVQKPKRKDSKIPTPLRNEELAEFLADQDRIFMNLSGREIQRLTTEYRRILRESLSS